MPHAFSRRLGESPILCDGAMGTALYARGVSPDARFDVLNLNRPALVQAVHAEYVSVGADCVETNTFGANRFKLAVHGLSDRVREINRDVDREIERFRRKLQAGARPMLSGRPPEEIEALFRAREPYYARAHLSVDTAGLGVDQVVARLLATLRDSHAARV